MIIFDVPHVFYPLPLLCWMSISVIILTRIFEPQLKFVWYCFIRPLGSIDQKDRLDKVGDCPLHESHESHHVSSIKVKQTSTTRRVVLSSVAGIQC